MEKHNVTLATVIDLLSAQTVSYMVNGRLLDCVFTPKC